MSSPYVVAYAGRQASRQKPESDVPTSTGCVEVIY